LIDFLAGQSNDELSNQLIDKMLTQSVVQSANMDDKNLTRALSILSRVNPTLQSIENKRILAERAQHFIDRYVDLL
jgi:hypothetical protein